MSKYQNYVVILVKFVIIFPTCIALNQIDLLLNTIIFITSLFNVMYVVKLKRLLINATLKMTHQIYCYLLIGLTLKFRIINQYWKLFKNLMQLPNAWALWKFIVKQLLSITNNRKESIRGYLRTTKGHFKVLLALLFHLLWTNCCC